MFKNMTTRTKLVLFTVLALILSAIAFSNVGRANAQEASQGYVYCTGDLVLKADHTWYCAGSEVLPLPTTSPSPTMTTSPSPSPTITTPAPTTPAPTQTTQALDIRPNFYMTFYSYWDNTPRDSANISHPSVHTQAGGVGTYKDPVTLAVGHSIIGGKDILDFAPGTLFYVPMLQRYFVVEDTCGDGPTPQNAACHRLDTPGNSAPAGAVAWIDGYIGGGKSGQGTSTAADSCMYKLTKLMTVVYNPPANLKVVNNGLGQSIYSAAGCSATYSNTVVYA